MSDSKHNQNKPAGSDVKVEAVVVDEKTGKKIGEFMITKRDMVVVGITAGVIALGGLVKFLMSKDVEIEKKEVEVPVPVVH